MNGKIRIRALGIAGIFLAVFLSFGCGKQMPANGDSVKSEINLKTGKLTEYVLGRAVLSEEEPGKVVYSFTMSLIPESDDSNVYLFAKECYENMENPEGEPIASCRKGQQCEISIDYEESYLFAQFIPALLLNGKYVPIGKGVYLENPELLAENQEAYPEIQS
ncbi:MAG: hypothetical protein K2N82_05355, partial [Lachnospiraceae bacterium]|nr:hypothetical protein [Lachnospiraceae bacterium]